MPLMRKTLSWTTFLLVMPFFPCLCDLWHNDLLEELDPVVSCGSIMRLISYFLSLSVEGGAASSCASRKGLPLSGPLTQVLFNFYLCGLDVFAKAAFPDLLYEHTRGFYSSAKGL